MQDPDRRFFDDVRYKRWDGTQRLDGLEADELLGAMSDELLSGGSLEDAMARLSRFGLPGRMEGMQDLLERLRAAKQKRAERHDLSGIFDELKEKLEEVKRLERDGLDRREQQETTDDALKQALEIPGMKGAVAKLGATGNPAAIAAGVEFILEGLHLNRKLNKERGESRSTFRG